MAIGDIGSLIDSFMFDASRGINISTQKVTDSIIANAYAGPDSDGWLKTIEIDSVGNINNTILGSYEFDDVHGTHPDLLKITDNIFVIAYEKSGEDGKLITVEIDNAGNIAYIDSLIFETTQCSYANIVHVTGDVFAISHQRFPNFGIKTVNIDNSGNIGSVIDSQLYAFRGRRNDIVHVTGNIYAISYQGADDDGYIMTVSISDAGTISNSIETFEFDGTQGRHNNILNVASDMVAVAYNGPTGGFLKTIEIDNAGDITTPVIDTWEFDVTVASAIATGHITEDVCAVFFKGLGAFWYLKTFKVTNGVISAIDVEGISELVTSTCDVTHVIGNIYALTYSDSSIRGRLRTIDIETPVAEEIKKYCWHRVGLNMRRF